MDSNISELEALVGRGHGALRYVLNWTDTNTRVKTIMRTFTEVDGVRATTEESLERLWETIPSLLSTIRSQEAALVEAREALEPFAKIAASVLRSPRKGFADDYDWITRQDGTKITFGHLRRAASALSKLEGGE